MNRLYLFFFSLWLASITHAQWRCTFTHYSSEDGLSQNSVMSILEDKNGFMWFATWDGINKFDGYTFRTYKVADVVSGIVNNRVDFMAEDAYGYIWIQTYDNRIYRFNPATEVFRQVPATGKESTFPVTSIRISDNNHIWLITENDGAIKVSTDPETHELSTTLYSLRSALFPSMVLHDICVDKAGNEWLLSDNGIGMITAGATEPVLYFVDSQSSTNRQKQSFYCMTEIGDQVYFGSRKGRVWLFDTESKSFRLLELDTEADIISIHAYMDNNLVAATRTDGFFIYNIETDKKIHINTQNTPSLPGNQILSVYIDRHQEIWLNLADAAGVTHFHPVSQTCKQEILQVEEGSAFRSQPAFSIYEDVNDYLWVHPFNGGFSIFDRTQNRLRPFFNESGAPQWRFSNKVHAAYSDSRGNLWMCTHSKGLEKISFLPEHFHLEVPVPLNYESLKNDVRSLFQDDKGRLWVGLRDGMIRLYDQNQYIGYLATDGSISKTLPALNSVAYNIIQDAAKRIWIATKGNGLFRAEEIRDKRFRLTNYQTNPDDLYSLSDNNIYSVHEDGNGRLWIATFGGGLNYMEEKSDGTVVFINHHNNLKGYPIDNCYRVRFVTSDSAGYIWLGTTSGVVAFKKDFTHPESIRFNHYFRTSAANSLHNNDVYWITETSDHALFFATFGGGLNKLLSIDDGGKATFKAYTIEDGLPSDVLLSIREDNDKRLWVSTESGLCSFLPSEEKTAIYNEKSMQIRARFNEAASERMQDGRILFGTNNGLLSFLPEDIHKSAFVPSVILSRLQINNEEIRPGEQSRLQQILNETDRLTLTHKENIVSIQYAAIDMKAPENIQYAYILEGFDTEWSYVDKQRIATYTNLPKGDYIFKVRSTNNDGVWVDNTRELRITILPSFRETPWAYMLYVIGILGIIFAAVYILFTIYRLKHKVSVEQQITAAKLRFFTNISHELRTPLTLISGPVEHVIKNTPLTVEAREQLQIVSRNTDRMLRLVNQILDFRKIQNQKMKMKVQRIEFVSFIRGIMDNFEAVADEHQLNFILESEQNSLYLWADADHLEKIIFNLLSNAFKFTQVGKMIKVFIFEEEKHISLGVQDQGTGIPANKKDSIFVRFENMVDKNLFNQPGSGIGLSLVKELVEMHKATISVDSAPGEGSTFMIMFKKGKEHFDETVEFMLTDYVDVSSGQQKTPSDDGLHAAEQIYAAAESRDNTAPRLMLIIEDNDELRSFLRTIFSSSFRVAEAKNGAEGIERATSLIPDIIISDVMIPDKDGIELTRQLRENLPTSHIPIILLTAKSSLESKLKGLEYGANDYITKPFSSTYLKARVENLLVQHQKIQELYRNNLMAIPSGNRQPLPLTNEMSAGDRVFIDKLVELMKQQMDNGELIVDDLVKELAVSRSVFFKKLKALTGLAPVEFIREMRVSRAAELIITGEYSVSQVSYMVGINDPRYFSKCFKQKFEMTPSEYKERFEQKRHSNHQNIHP